MPENRLNQHWRRRYRRCRARTRCARRLRLECSRRRDHRSLLIQRGTAHLTEPVARWHRDPATRARRILIHTPSIPASATARGAHLERAMIASARRRSSRCPSRPRLGSASQPVSLRAYLHVTCHCGAPTTGDATVWCGLGRRQLGLCQAQRLEQLFFEVRRQLAAGELFDDRPGQQLLDRDGVPVGYLGAVHRDRIGQGDAALVDQLQKRCAGHRLGVGSDMEVVVDADWIVRVPSLAPNASSHVDSGVRTIMTAPGTSYAVIVSSTAPRNSSPLAAAGARQNPASALRLPRPRGRVRRHLGAHSILGSCFLG